MSPHFVVRLITVSSVFLLWLPAGFAQTTAAPSRPTTGTIGTPSSGNTGSPGTPTIPSTSNPSNTTKNNPTYTPRIFLTGRVTLEDGSPPPEPTTIERVCGGQSHAEGYSDSQGNFGIQLGDESAVFQDASESPARGGFGGVSTNSTSSGTGSNSNGLGPATGMGVMTRYQNCELRAKLAGYRSQAISLANRSALDDPNVGTILLHKDGGETGTTVSASALGAPKDARKAYDRGMQAVRKNRPDDAIKEFQKTVELYSAHAEAWYELGRIQASRREADAARQSFNASLKADPKFVNPYVQLSILTLDAKNWPELAELTDRAMRLDSFDYPQLFLFNAIANYNMHKFDVAESSIKQAVRLDTQRRFPEIPHLFGLIMLLHKNYSGAAEQFRMYLKMAPDAQDAATVRTQLTELEQITARSEVVTPKGK